MAIDGGTNRVTHVVSFVAGTYRRSSVGWEQDFGKPRRVL